MLSRMLHLSLQLLEVFLALTAAVYQVKNSGRVLRNWHLKISHSVCDSVTVALAALGELMVRVFELVQLIDLNVGAHISVHLLFHGNFLGDS